jgi:8-oxo-dGTP pyrophosphatase MutT (NUDIX family)
MNNIKYLEEKKKSNISSHRFSDEIYAQILDSIVITTVDIILVCGEKILLAKRSVNPLANRWAPIGGRMIAGEQPAETAQRKLSEEAGLNISALSRFEFYQVYSAYYPVRHQPPHNNGSHTTNLNFVVIISEEEKSHINLIESEYLDSCWVNLDKAVDFVEKDSPNIYMKTTISDLIDYLKKIIFKHKPL